MVAALPEYFFRTRENGAFVFKVDQETRQRRIEMDQIAVVNINNGTIKPHGERRLEPEDVAAIEAWMTERRVEMARRVIDDINRTVDHLNQVSHWIQSKASDDEVDAVTDQLLLSMRDLRETLVRRRAERVQRARAGG